MCETGPGLDPKRGRQRMREEENREGGRSATIRPRPATVS